MSECLKGCKDVEAFGTVLRMHVEGCPESAPKPEPPKDVASEPDFEAADEVAKGQVDYFKSQCGQAIPLNLCRAYLALRAKVERLKEELRGSSNAFVEMNAVFESVMRAARGESLSEFDLSYGSVSEVAALCAENAALKAQIEECLKRWNEEGDADFALDAFSRRRLDK